MGGKHILGKKVLIMASKNRFSMYLFPSDSVYTNKRWKNCLLKGGEKHDKKKEN